MRKYLSKKHMDFILAIVGILSIVFILVNYYPKSAKAETIQEEKIAYLTEEEFSFTNNDIVNGMNINDYVFAKGVSHVALTNKVVMTVTGTDDIARILPEQYFRTPGQTFHIGKEWGFFVECFKPRDEVDLFITTVILLDVNNNNDMTQTGTHLSFDFNRVVQADFSYVPGTEDQMYSIAKKENPFFNDNYKYDVSLIYEGEATSRIIPLPTHLDKVDEIKWLEALGEDASWLKNPPWTGVARNTVAMRQHNKYMFTDLGAATSLFNVNDLNQQDSGYVGERDYGAFFTQSDFFYQGIKFQKGKIDPDEEASFYWEATMYGFRDALTYHVPFAGEIFDAVGFCKDIKNLYSSVHDSAIAVGNQKTYRAKQNSKSEQLKLPGGLCKNSFILARGNSIETTSDNENQQLFITKEFSFDYQLQDQANLPEGVSLKDVRYITTLSINLMPMIAREATVTDFGNKITNTTIFSNNLNFTSEANYKEIPEVNAVNGAANFDSHILPNYYNLIKFTPDISGYYNITGNYKDGNTSNLGISIYEIGSGVTHLNLGNTIRTSTNGVVTSVLLESGKSYYVKSNLKAGNLSDGFYYGDFSLNFNRDAKLVDIGATTIEFDSSGYSYIKLQADGNYYYTFNTSGINVAMTDENMNNITGYVEAVGVKLDNGTLQYFRIERTSNVDSIVLTVEKRRKIVYKFENGQSDESVWVINDNYPTMPTPGAKEGYQYLGWCEPGETGIHYIQSTIWSIDKADITLVADWAKTYMVHYDTRGGSSILDEEFNERWPAILSKNTKLTGHSLMGWHLSPDCKDSRIEYLPPGINTDTTVYAEWLQVDFTITFKDGGNVLRKYVVKEGITVSAPIISNIRYHNGRWKSVFGNTIASGSSYACKGYDEIFNIEWILITPYNAGTYTRNGEYTITDNGVFSQSYDNVFTFSNEVTNLYRTARITVQFTAREKDDGYQHVMLYDGASSGSTLLAERIFEHGGSKKDTSPARYEFVFEIDILYLSNKSLCVRYSASGFGADTWYNSAMTCSIILYE